MDLVRWEPRSRRRLAAAGQCVRAEADPLVLLRTIRVALHGFPEALAAVSEALRKAELRV